MKKIILLLAFLTSGFADAESVTLFVNQQRVLQSFPSYKALIKKLEVLMQDLENEKQKIVQFVEKIGQELKAKKQKIDSDDKRNLKASAALMKDFENAQKQATNQLKKMQDKAVLVEQKVIEHKQIINKWLSRLHGKDVQALKNVVEKRKDKVIAVFKSDDLLFVASTNDITAEVSAELHRMNKDAIK